MARYEVALATPVTLGAGGDDAEDGPVRFEFNGHPFAWHHAPAQTPHVAPVITTPIGDGDYAAERLLANRCLSALSFLLDQPIAVLATAATGFKGELDPPILGQPAVLSPVVMTAPQSITVAPDDRLQLVLGLYREGRAATSPFYRLLAFFNALDASFDGDGDLADRFVDERVDELPRPSKGWSRHLREDQRNAVAHAVRPRGRAVLDPDDLADWTSLVSSSDRLRRLVRARVTERWPGDAVMTR